MPKRKGEKVLDVGCGTGQVVHLLSEFGFDAYGVDVSPIAISIAKAKGKGKFELMKGRKIPFPDNFFHSVGCYDVLEHTLRPAELLDEMIRVLKPEGKMVIACPNFLRVIGLKAHHPRTKGLKNKAINLFSLLKKYVKLRILNKDVEWDFMEPILDPSAGPDHDAVCITNPIDIGTYLRRKGCVTIYHSSLLTYPKHRLLSWISELPLIRTVTGGVFIVAIKGKD